MKFDLTKSKSTWGGIAAIAILLVRQILIHNGVIIPYQEWDLAILLIDAVAAAFGIYGFRDAIRKLQVDQYYNDPLKKNIPKNDKLSEEYVAQLEENFMDQQYKDNERVTFADGSKQTKDEKILASRDMLSKHFSYRKDVNIISECILTDEPTFTLRAKDMIAVSALAQYIHDCKRHCTPEYIEELEIILKRFMHWRDANPTKMKIPD